MTTVLRGIRSLSLAALATTAVVAYFAAGAMWTLLVSVQRATSGWDPVDHVFLIRALLRIPAWPIDIQLVTRIPSVVTIIVFVCLVVAAVALSKRRG